LVVEVVLNRLPEVPDVPEVPFVPDVPEDPEVPDEPDVPDVPDVPEVPDDPEVPEEPLEPEVPDVPDVVNLGEKVTLPLPVSYANKNGASAVSAILPLLISKLPVIPTEPEIIISLASPEERASIILKTCSARIILPLAMPEVLIVAI